MVTPTSSHSFGPTQGLLRENWLARCKEKGKFVGFQELPKDRKTSQEPTEQETGNSRALIDFPNFPDSKSAAREIPFFSFCVWETEIPRPLCVVLPLLYVSTCVLCCLGSVMGHSSGVQAKLILSPVSSSLPHPKFSELERLKNQERKSKNLRSIPNLFPIRQSLNFPLFPRCFSFVCRLLLSPRFCRAHIQVDFSQVFFFESRRLE